MTRKSKARLRRGQRKIPKSDDTAGVVMMEGKAIFITNDMLIKQLQRDGPKVARSFDGLARRDIVECSRIFARCSARLIPFMPQPDETGFKETAARLLFSALNAYVASIEVARHGYPRQYGASARLVVETIAVVLDIATVADSLEKFHKGKLKSTKSMQSAKKCLPMLGEIYGLLSNDFVHIGRGHATLEGPSLYNPGDQALRFVTMTSRALVVFIDVVADLIFGSDAGRPIYWKPEGGGWRFDPDPEILALMEVALQTEPPA